jgi:hypothetical protein
MRPALDLNSNCKQKLWARRGKVKGSFQQRNRESALEAENHAFEL